MENWLSGMGFRKDHFGRWYQSPLDQLHRINSENIQRISVELRLLDLQTRMGEKFSPYVLKNSVRVTNGLSKVTSVIISQEHNYFTVTCGKCNGTGTDHRGFNCGTCETKGKIVLKVPPSWIGEDVGLVRCGTCSGTGIDRHDFNCGVCDGVGVIVKCFPRLTCSKCGGTGEDSSGFNCEACGRIGSIWIGNQKNSEL